MVESNATPTVEGAAPAREWRLAPGVSLVEGLVLGQPQTSPHHGYTLVRPDGRRFMVTEALYRLAELLEQRQPLATIAARLSEQLSRPLTVADVAALIERKLLPWDVVAPR